MNLSYALGICLIRFGKITINPPTVRKVKSANVCTYESRNSIEFILFHDNKVSLKGWYLEVFNDWHLLNPSNTKLITCATFTWVLS